MKYDFGAQTLTCHPKKATITFTAAALDDELSLEEALQLSLALEESERTAKEEAEARRNCPRLPADQCGALHRPGAKLPRQEG